MPECHDNTKPARSGSFSISRYGVIYYFPIEEAGYLKPFMALIMQDHPDGKLTASVDTIWPGTVLHGGFKEEEEGK